VAFGFQDGAALLAVLCVGRKYHWPAQTGLPQLRDVVANVGVGVCLEPDLAVKEVQEGLVATSETAQPSTLPSTKLKVQAARSRSFADSCSSVACRKRGNVPGSSKGWPLAR